MGQHLVGLCYVRIRAISVDLTLSGYPACRSEAGQDVDLRYYIPLLRTNSDGRCVSVLETVVRESYGQTRRGYSVGISFNLVLDRNLCIRCLVPESDSQQPTAIFSPTSTHTRNAVI